MSILRSLKSAAAPAAILAGLVGAVPALADADVAKEMATAEAHAGFAVKATDMKGVQMHLQHVVNCMVGPNGKGFDASPGNPCKDQGAGVMPDFKGTRAKRHALQQALDDARAGLKATDVAVAREKATAAGELIKKAM